MIENFFTVALISERTGRVRKYKIPVKLLLVLLVFLIAAVLSFAYILRDRHQLKSRFIDIESAAEKITEQEKIIEEFARTVQRNELKLQHLKDDAYKIGLLLSQPPDPVSLPSAKSLGDGFDASSPNTITDNRLLRIIEQELQESTSNFSADFRKANQQIITVVKHAKEKHFEYIPSIQPSQGLLISGFGVDESDPFRSHFSIRLATRVAATVKASASGMVLEIKKNDHGNHDLTVYHGNDFITRYVNLEKVSVAQGDLVSKNQSVGTVGVDESYKTPIMEYQVLLNGIPQNPITYIQDR